MFRSVFVALPFAMLLLAGINAEEAKVQATEENRGAPGGGQGYSQQYHYNSYPQGGGGHDPYGYTYAGLSFDLSTGLFLALGAIIVLLALAAVIYPLMTKGTGYGDSYNSYGSSYGSYRANLEPMTTKVWQGLQKAYELYNTQKTA
jgi:hypothetical protein